MKRYFVLAILAILAVACGEQDVEPQKKPSEGVLEEPDVTLGEEDFIAPTVFLRSNLLKQPQYTLCVYSVNDYYSWSELNSGRVLDINTITYIRYHDYIDDELEQTVEQVLSKMKEQHDNSEDCMYLTGDYIFDTPVSLSIVANTTLGGRAAGEELNDLFNIWSNMPRYTYPEGDLVSFSDDEYRLAIGIEEWVHSGYMLYTNFNIIPKHPFPESEFRSDLELSMKLETKDAGLIMDCKFFFNMNLR